MIDYAAIRDSTYERLISAGMSSSCRTRFIQHRDDYNDLIRQLVDGIDFVLAHDCVTADHWKQLIADPAHDMSRVYPAILAWAVKTSRADFVDWLLERAGLQDELPDALRFAARVGHTAVVEVLLRHGADARVTWSAPLRYAAACGHRDTVKVLLAAGADPTVDNSAAERLASEAGHHTIADLIAASRNRGAA